MSFIKWIKKHWKEILSAPPQKEILMTPISPELAEVMTDKAGKQMREAFPEIIIYKKLYRKRVNTEHRVGESITTFYGSNFGNQIAENGIEIKKWSSSITVGPHTYSFWYARRHVTQTEHLPEFGLTVKYRMEDKKHG